MDAEEILAKAKLLVRERPDATNEHGWIIFPLLRNKVIVDSVGWIFSILVGMGLFVAVALGTIPYNFQHGVGAALVAVVLMALTLFIGLGSMWALYGNIRRLQEADRHIIVITQDDFLQQEGDKIVQVPLEHVRHVTARGDRAPDRTPPKGESVRDVPGVGENVTGFFLGRHNTPSGMKQRRGRMRTPTTLAFIDTRTNSDVVVVNDKSYGDPYVIAAFLKQYAGAIQQINT
jgi:hypothetical protein